VGFRADERRVLAKLIRLENELPSFFIELERAVDALLAKSPAARGTQEFQDLEWPGRAAPKRD
jgi:hypothetical protein